MALFGVRSVYGGTLVLAITGGRVARNGAMAAWGVRESAKRSHQHGRGVIFGATVLAFYFSQVMDKRGTLAPA